MAYIYNLSKVLTLMGYELDTDFYVEDNDDGNGPLITQWNHVDDTPTETEVSTFYDNYLLHSDRLGEYKLVARGKVDIAAERARRRYLSFGSGQAMSYLRKEDDAQAYKDAGYPALGSPVEYPWVNAEAEATNVTAQQAADTILAQRDAWLVIGVQIEKERRIGKENIDAANDEDGVNTARDTVIAILEGI